MSTKGHPCFAALYDPINRLGERRLLQPLRRQIVGPARGRVLEVGVGTGLNLPLYQPGVTLVATDPDPFMLRRAVGRAQKLARPVRLLRCAAENLPFHDASFDTVVVTLVLCSVVDQAQALAEVRRVLKPDGSLRFIEHVRAADRRTARLQERLTPAWNLLGAGCHLDRRTLGSMDTAGFQIVELQQSKTPMPLLPFIAGVAVRR